MDKHIEDRLKQLPNSPGVYLHKDKSGEIIYVGKAAVLKNRVSQYFQKSRLHDSKTDVLVSEIADIDWIEVDNELDALFLEAELVRRYLPKYNILLRDDKSSTYVRINMQDDFPFVSYVRRPLDDKATYIGPFFTAGAVRKALRVLRKAFPYSTHRTLPPRVCLQYHLDLCPGIEEGKIDSKEYKKQLRQLIGYLQGDRKKIIKQLELEMQGFATKQNFEMAAKRRNQLNVIKSLSRQIIFGDSEFLDISKDYALMELTNLLGLLRPPRRIEGYDISHMSGTNTVASMVVFVNGLPAKAEYRKFVMKIPGNDDFAHMREVMMRRFAERNKKWPRPDLLLIDGGKGQLGSVLDVIRVRGNDIPAVGLAKKRELIIVDNNRSNVSIQIDAIENLKGFSKSNEEFTEIDIPDSSNIIKLLQRIRDESHRFAISYHSYLKRTNQLKNKLEELPGIGPKTRTTLIKQFGSVSRVFEASLDELTTVIGMHKAQIIKSHALEDESDILTSPDK